jgi:SAM-dependent methyltransferase
VNEIELSWGASLRLPLIEKQLRTLRPTHILEVGCGEARISQKIAKFAQVYTACEPDLFSYNTALLHNTGNIRLVNGTIEAIPNDHKFDVIFSTEVLEHIDDDFKEIQSWNRLLSLNGYVLLTVPVHPRLFGPADRRVGHRRRYTRGTLIELFNSCGFEVEEVFIFGGFPSFLINLAQNLTATLDSVDSTDGAYESGRWHQPNIEKSRSMQNLGRWAKRLLFWLSLFPKEIGVSALLRARKISTVAD